MRTFLEYVARDIIEKHGTDLSRIAVVFPNKRASLFLNEYLAQIAGSPIWSPSYITISELFRRHSTLKVGDPIKLICDLYRSYTGVTGTDETLDHFYGWGQIMLADFDDIDKNMADAEKIFKNVGDIHELDDVSYLNAEQIAAIQKFFSNFSEEKTTELKQRFLKMWSRFSDIYNDFNARLTAQGLAYEGALYRQVAGDETVDFEYDKYIFVGFNVLQRVEQRLFDRLMKDGKAKFYWDFDKYYMTGDGIGENNHRSVSEAGHYISSYLEHYPNELDTASDEIYSNFGRDKKITYISAPTENIQARYISSWLREGVRIADGRKTAVVLCNESLLQTAIHCIPDEVTQVNITTGYPLAQSPFASLVSALIDLRTDGYSANASRFRLKYVNALLRHPYISYMTGAYPQLLKKINVDAKMYYPAEKDLAIDDGCRILFRSIEGNASKPYTQRMMEWMLEVLRLVASNAATSSDPLFQESLFQTYTLVNRLNGLIASGDLTVDVITLRRLMRQVLQATSIPFHGEPAIGVQFMGVLETRNIDFSHVLVLSCSEGNMPKGVNDTSFIPYSIRKAHGLTTIDNKVAIYAYYFHRLLQRADDITLVYNNSTDGSSTGEMSRFMLQMLVESGHSIERKTLRASQSAYSLVRQPIAKTDEVMERLHRRFDLKYSDPGNDNPLLTPTAINTYGRCQLQFYYSYVVGIREADENEEDEIDFATFGVIFHDTAQEIYERLRDSFGPVIQKEHLQKLYNADAYLEGVISDVFNKQLFKIPQNSTMTPDYNGLQLINFNVIKTYIKLLIKTDMKLAPFRILSLEEPLKRNITITADGGSFESTIGGRVDRMDQITTPDGMRIRIIDYKTGRFHGQNLPATVEDIFDRDKKASNVGYYLQTFLYSGIARSSLKLNPLKLSVSPALLYIQHTSGDDYDPTLCFGNEKITDIAPHSADFNRLLSERLSEIFSRAVDFTPTSDENICANCPYLQMCGRYVDGHSQE